MTPLRRVVFLNPVGTFGGAERVLLHCVKAAAENNPGVERHAVLGDDGELADRLRDLGVNVRVLSFGAGAMELGDTALRRSSLPRFGRFAFMAALASPSLLGYRRKLRQLLRDLAPDLIHSNGLKMHLFSSVASPRGTPVIWHLHDFYSERLLASRMLGWAARRAAAGVAVSEAVRRDLQHFAPRLPAFVVLNPIDGDEFTSHGQSAEIDALASLPSSPPSAVRIGLVATYANWKGHDVFLKALARLQTPTPWRGYVVGGPIYATSGSQVSRDELQALAHLLGIADRVGFIPPQHDVAAVLRSLDVVVHASTRPEPFGLTIAEAMSCGRATIVAAAGGALELLRDGETALGHRPGDDADLASVIDRLAQDSDLRARLGAASRAWSLAHLSPARFAQELDAVYTFRRRSADS